MLLLWSRRCSQRGSHRPHPPARSQNYDGTGGNGSALRHFEATGKKYPLVVKLGTITPAGADVYSYAEDEGDMVLDPRLAEHLAHWGINVLQMEKTEKTMAELEIATNLAVEFDKITEAGSALAPLSGPGFVGLENLGNSCYVASVLQVLWTLPELQARYAAAAAAEGLFRTAPADAGADFLAQFAKVGAALVRGAAAEPPARPAGAPVGFDALAVATGGGLEAVVEAAGGGGAVKPRAFKSLVGRGHPEFSSARQQDAHEFFGHLLEVMARAERSAGARLPGAADAPSSKLLEFAIETRIECTESHRVTYKPEATTVLSLEIPLEAATNKAEVEQSKEREQKRQKLKVEGEAAAAGKGEEDERVIPRVPLAACLAKFAADEPVEDYMSAFLGRKTTVSWLRARAVHSARISPLSSARSLPPYALVGAGLAPRAPQLLPAVPYGAAAPVLRRHGLDAQEAGGVRRGARAHLAPGAARPRRAARRGAPARGAARGGRCGRAAGA